jgi:hypothetical protein
MKRLASVLAFALIIVLVPGFALNGEETCPDGDGWVKIDSDDLSLYPVEGATAYCFKAGSSNSQGCEGGIFDTWPQPEGTCGLSHWSYFIGDPTPTPTDPPPTETPTDPPPTETPTSTPTDPPPTETPTEPPPTETPTEPPPTETPTTPPPTPTKPPPPETGYSSEFFVPWATENFGVSSEINIPAIDFKANIVSGYYDGEWIFGAEYHEGTYWPSFDLIGLHASDYARLLDLERGDIVYFDNELFFVFGISVIGSQDIWDLDQADLMLITCTGPSYSQRVMVYTQRFATSRFIQMLVP